MLKPGDPVTPADLLTPTIIAEVWTECQHLAEGVAPEQVGHDVCRRRILVRAAALIVGEIEQIDLARLKKMGLVGGEEGEK